MWKNQNWKIFIQRLVNFFPKIIFTKNFFWNFIKILFLYISVINPNESNETNVKSKSLAKRLSLALNGRPVYLSYSFNQHSEAMEELLQLSEMETKLFQLIKSQPKFEWYLLAIGPSWNDYFSAKSIAKNIDSNKLLYIYM